MQWFRMYHEFATDPKVQMLSEVDQRRYIMMLCLKCCNGNVTLHETTIAFQLRISLDEWRATKATLVSKNLLNEDNSPPSWDKRQYVSDSSTARVAKHREKAKGDVKQECNVSVTPPEADADTESDTEKKEDKRVEVSKILKSVNGTYNGEKKLTMAEFLESQGYGEGEWPNKWADAAHARCPDSPKEAYRRLNKAIWFFTKGNGKTATATEDRWDRRVFDFCGDKKPGAEA